MSTQHPLPSAPRKDYLPRNHTSRDPTSLAICLPASQRAWTIIKKALARYLSCWRPVTGDPAAAALGHQYCKGPQPSSSPSMCISSVQMATSSYCVLLGPHLAGRAHTGMTSNVRVMESCHFTTVSSKAFQCKCHFHSPPAVPCHPSQEETFKSLCPRSYPWLKQGFISGSGTSVPLQCK